AAELRRHLREADAALFAYAAQAGSGSTPAATEPPPPPRQPAVWALAGAVAALSAFSGGYFIAHRVHVTQPARHETARRVVRDDAAQSQAPRPRVSTPTAVSAPAKPTVERLVRPEAGAA